MRGALVVGSVLSLILSSAPALAWWDGGHMQVAAVAYSILTPQKSRLSELDRWIAGVPKNKKAPYAFVHAAVWMTSKTLTAGGFNARRHAPERRG
ncbi:conserved exported hypothetical protein [Mesorhizobium escarrei]|uniref:Uncharacterized protein n=1 Tax=Mesorhizobium escarrei TaxID=666018 RepID=A0ABM9E1D5_9HYPH|nr:conserved exported hypothetical protein [Mesorhizobium escarrei]